MTQVKFEMKKTALGPQHRHSEKGSAMVIALLIMILLMGFVALAVSRTNSETIASANDENETRSYEAAHASLEVLTRNFNKIFETKLTIAPADITRIQGQYPPGFTTEYTFNQTVTQTQATKDVVMTGELFQGLNARRDEWQLDSEAVDKDTGVRVTLRRRFLNNRIPIFQFGIFYDDDLEFHPGPRFDFGGRVHSNGHMFMQANDGLYFSSKVSTAKEVFTDVSKNGSSWTNWDDEVYIRNASGSYVQLRSNMGSVLASPANGSAVTASPLPTAYDSASWTANENLFQGNLLARAPELQLPIKINGDLTLQNLDNIEVVKRGKKIGDLINDGTGSTSSPSITPVVAANSDDKITAAERYYNKNGIRISIADTKAKLPGCAAAGGGPVTTQCGLRMDGDAAGLTAGAVSGTRGYQPLAMQGSPTYQATQMNGRRFDPDGREFWIKIETVQYNATTIEYDTRDITADILSLGVTDQPPNNSNFSITDANYNANGIDGRTIFGLQRYTIEGPDIPNSGFISVGGGYNMVIKGTVSSSNSCSNSSHTLTTTGFDTGSITGSPSWFPNNFTTDDRAVMRKATIAGTANRCVVPIPIQMFDTREGLYNDTTSVFNPTSNTAPGYGTNVPWAGVMSMIDVDIANLKRFLDGNFNNNMPSGTPAATALGRPLRNTDIPQNNGWVLYISDRRGDFDFDGEYDMEDIYGPNDGGTPQPGEDVNGNGTLQTDYGNESIRFTGTGSSISPDIAATFDHKFYRRGIRLINGTQPPGNYNAGTPANTRGFTVASENAVYVQGNYNATGIASAGTPTPSTDYLPQGANDVPCSIAADAITVLSNNWNDGQSFVYPFTMTQRDSTETTQRFAMLSGDTITSLNGTPNQGGGDPRMNGGVHNFLRFLEEWGGRYNYSGSLINLYNSHNNNGSFKCCDKVYSPPTRNWVFDVTFLDVNRLPPGTPYFQNIQMTGFQRVNY